MWFANTLIPNLPKERKVVKKHHNRLVEKSPKMTMTKKDMSSYMIKHRMDIPLPQPVKPAALQKVCEVNIPNKYVADEMTLDTGCSVLRSPPYQCISNPTINSVESIKTSCSAFKYLQQSMI